MRPAQYVPQGSGDSLSAHPESQLRLSPTPWACLPVEQRRGLAEPQVSGLWTPAWRSSPSPPEDMESPPQVSGGQAGSPPGGSRGPLSLGTRRPDAPGSSDPPGYTFLALLAAPGGSWGQRTGQLPQHTQFPQVWWPLKLILRLSTNTATFRHTHTEHSDPSQPEAQPDSLPLGPAGSLRPRRMEGRRRAGQGPRDHSVRRPGGMPRPRGDSRDDMKDRESVNKNEM